MLMTLALSVALRELLKDTMSKSAEKGAVVNPYCSVSSGVCCLATGIQLPRLQKSTANWRVTLPIRVDAGLDAVSALQSAQRHVIHSLTN